MSATPIPRTLEMSLTGIREMSTILTPPEERHPVLTFVGAYDEKQVAAAIRRELLRDGQVFYLHNRVDSIERAAARLRELVPEARVAVGARADERGRAWSRSMVGFWEKEFDVLVSTTIVESGLDIPNANTLIVERADLFGLSQLHQLRGRVGRGRERAYAYFLYPPEKPLTETAHDRLPTIAPAHRARRRHVRRDEGPGDPRRRQPARRRAVRAHRRRRLRPVRPDGRRGGRGLPRRGAGRTRSPTSRSTCRSTRTCRTTTSPGERLRLETYRALAAADSDEAVDAVRDELADRYGPLPEPVANLLQVARFRVFARRYGVTEVSLQGSVVRFSPLSLRESQEMRMHRLYPRSVWKSSIGTISVPRPGKPGQPLRDVPLLDWARNVLLRRARRAGAGGGPCLTRRRASTGARESLCR